jgi:hypothetical protein
LAGAVKAIDAEASPLVPTGEVGALGFFSGSKKAEINPAGERIAMLNSFYDAMDS